MYFVVTKIKKLHKSFIRSYTLLRWVLKVISLEIGRFLFELGGFKKVFGYYIYRLKCSNNLSGFYVSHCIYASAIKAGLHKMNYYLNSAWVLKWVTV